MKKKSLKSYNKKIDFNSENYSEFSPSSLKRIADYWLRQYLISQADIRNGSVLCPLKNKWFSIEKIQVAHFIDRNCMTTRYDLKNCHLISEESNSFDSKYFVDGYKSKHHKDYEEFLLLKIGSEELEKLKSKSSFLELFDRENYIEKIKFFRNECGK